MNKRLRSSGRKMTWDNQRLQEKTVTVPLYACTWLMWTDVGLNLCLCGERLETNCLSHAANVHAFVGDILWPNDYFSHTANNAIEAYSHHEACDIPDGASIPLMFVSAV